MNVKESNDSASSSKTEVTSKYFVHGNDMDDSLSEFQEKKKYKSVPKKEQPKKPRKRPIKQIKGQKTIKSLLNRKNELVKYTNEFDLVCKQSGVDVDSEQLQLAVALSKSLQETENTPETIGQVKSLTSEARVLKIRTTLQEYGFKVGNNIPVKSNKKNIRSRNNYKLISFSDLEKQKIISDRYAEVLLNKWDPIANTNTQNYSYNTLYYKSTNILYEDLKDDNIFVVSNLFEKAVNNIRLRNWSEIPGRPVSPVHEGPFISFKDIEYNQDELDSILSGSLRTIQQILTIKLQINFELYNAQFGINRIVEMSRHSKMKCDEIKKQNSSLKPMGLQSIELPAASNTLLSVAEHSRCVSPDFFDDEDSIVLDTPQSSKKDETRNIKNCNPQANHDVLDLTDCVNIVGKFNSVCRESTVRKSDDFTEITNLVPIVCTEIYEEIDLTQNKEELNDNTIEYCVEDEANCNVKSLVNSDIVYVNDEEYTSTDNDRKKCTNNESKEYNSSTAAADFRNIEGTSQTMDLTQSSNSSAGLPDIVLRSKKDKDVSLDDTIIINENCHEIAEQNGSNVNKNQEVFDLTVDYGLQMSNLDDRNVVSMGIDETKNNENAQGFSDFSGNIDLTQSPNSSIECNSNDVNSPPGSPKFETLGKINNLSVDYDRMFDHVMESYSNTTQSSDKSQSNQTNSFTRNETSNSSSLREPEKSHKAPNSNYIDFGGISVLEEFSNDDKDICVTNENSCLPTACNLSGPKTNDIQDISPLKGDNNLHYNILKTPSSKDYVIKTDEVTPMPNYEAMSTPEMNRELDKYGVKPFKRKRAIKLLTYIYNQTHPIVDSCVEDESSPSKKLKMSQSLVPEKASSPKKIKSPRAQTSQKSPTIDKENNVYEVTSVKPVIKDIECRHEDWVFQTREKTKISSCRVPLHIAFHNYVHSRRSLREAILSYEPVNIDVIHKDLVASGYRYNPKDLLRFMDRKCITVKTADNDKRNKR